MASFQRQVPPPFAHQKESTDFFVDVNAGYDASDPGTGKTRVFIDVINFLQTERGARKALVLAPKSILQASWGNDFGKFLPRVPYSVAYASNRHKAFKEDAKVFITNHDAVKWLEDQPDLLAQFDILVVDEITAFKHRTSQRSKSLAKIASHFKYRYGLSGSMTPNGILDIWHQVFVLDLGKSLGNNFWKFRNTVCEPVQQGNHPKAVKWVDKPGAKEAVMDLLDGMMKRHVLEDCIDIPPNSVHKIYIDLPDKLMRTYKEMKERAIFEYNDKEVSAVHAAALRTKLLQIASGAVYDQTKDAVKLNQERYDLVTQLTLEREQCVIAYNWEHQLEGLLASADKAGIEYRVINGSVKDKDRLEAVDLFQAGKIKNIYAHPQSAGHGLTLTKGTTTIWTSPIDNAEYFQQFNRRIYRNGQKRKTETLLICANNTLEGRVYDNLENKVTNMTDLLFLLEAA